MAWFVCACNPHFYFHRKYWRYVMKDVTKKLGVTFGAALLAWSVAFAPSAFAAPRTVVIVCPCRMIGCNGQGCVMCGLLNCIYVPF